MRVPDERLVELYRAGWSMRRIASEVGIDRKTATDRLERLGVRDREPARTPKVTPADLEAAIAEGLTTIELARRLRVSPNTVTRAARRAGITMPRSDRPPARRVTWGHVPVAVENPGHPFLRLELPNSPAP